MIPTLPFFIVFEGIDGSGKSTLADMLYNELNECIPSVRLFEPTDGEFGNRIRSILNGGGAANAEDLMKLFLLDRQDDVKRNVKPALIEKKLIIMDRYYYSNAAYQGAMGISPEIIISRNMEMGFPEPDRIYLIDIDPDIALERILSRRIKSGNSSDPDIFEKKIFLSRVRDIYMSLRNEKFIVINGDAQPENIIKCVLNDLKSHYLAS
jgi:dTMP kinase